ncbi:MAG: hypothetical protein LLG08_08575, partial [Actinomycetia bacterium]|nr:hypothetical protein [Actinomycetes bacterium]
ARGDSEERLPGVGCKRKDMLKLKLEDYLAWADMTEEAYRKCAQFLHQHRIFDARDIPYKTQLVPMAAIFAILGHEAGTDGAREKIARWFWCGVFGELYGGTTESRFAKDLPDVVEWVRGSDVEPTTVRDALFSASRLYTMRSRLSAAYKGVYALLMTEGSLDLRTGMPIEIHTYFDERMDIHHLFPQAWCNAHYIERGLRDSIVNKAALTVHTNRMIGGAAPSEYIPRIEKSAGISRERMDLLLASHLADASAMRADDFPTFFEKRRGALLERIEKAMGKPSLQDIPAEEPEEAVDDDAETQTLSEETE